MIDIRTELGEAPQRDDEAEIIESIIRSNKQMMPRRDGRALRAQHPKSHGWARALLHVPGHLPKDVPEDLGRKLRIGLFEGPAIYEANVRFSNGAKEDDTEDDAHGLAIRLFGVPDVQPSDGSEDARGSADILLVDNETFFAGDIAEYDAFNDLLGEIIGFQRRGENAIHAVLNGIYLKFFRRLVKRDLLSPALEFSDQNPVSPLRARYWSTTPYLLGSHAVKYALEPLPPPAATELKAGASGPNGLGERLMADLATGQAEFEFSVDVQESPERHPVEDPSVAWHSERGATRVRLARLEVLSAIEGEDAERLELETAFNPWNVPSQHRPLGAINRIRGEIYRALADARNR